MSQIVLDCPKFAKRKSSLISRRLSYVRLEPRKLLAIDLSGTISQDTTFDDPEGYRIVGDLVIENGVTVQFNDTLVEDDGNRHQISFTNGTDRSQFRVRNTQFHAPNLDLLMSSGDSSQQTLSFTRSTVRLYSLFDASENYMSIYESDVNVVDRAELLLIGQKLPIGADDVLIRSTITAGNELIISVQHDGEFYDNRLQAPKIIYDNRMEGETFRSSVFSNLPGNNDPVHFVTSEFIDDIRADGNSFESPVDYEFSGKTLRGGAYSHDPLIQSVKIGSFDVQENHSIQFQGVDVALVAPSSSALIVRGELTFDDVRVVDGGQDSILNRIMTRNDGEFIATGSNFEFVEFVPGAVFNAASLGGIRITESTLVDTEITANAGEVQLLDNQFMTSTEESDVEFLIGSPDHEFPVTLNILRNTFSNVQFEFNETPAGEFTANKLLGNSSMNLQLDRAFTANFEGNFIPNGLAVSGDPAFGPIDFAENNWGVLTAAQIEELVVHNVDRPELPVVTFEPFLMPNVGGPESDRVQATFGASSLIVEFQDGPRLEYPYSEFDEVEIWGGDGEPDVLNVWLSEMAENVTMEPGQATISRADLDVVFRGFEDVEISSNATEDSVNFLATTDMGKFDFASDESATLSSSESLYRAIGFSEINVEFASDSLGGHAKLVGSEGDDEFFFTRTLFGLTTETERVRVRNFQSVRTLGKGGSDLAMMGDTTLDDAFISQPGVTYLTNANGIVVHLTSFEDVQIRSQLGTDRAYINDTPGDDQYFGNSNYGQLKFEGGQVYAAGFKVVAVRAFNGGNDEAFFQDSALNDTFVLSSNYASISDGNTKAVAQGFNYVVGRSREGFDVAHISDTAGDDNLQMFSHRTVQSSEGLELHAIGFANVFASSTTGNDVATFVDSQGDDYFVAKVGSGLMRGNGYQNFAIGFDQNLGFARNGGLDVAALRDSAGNDRLIGNSNGTTLQGNGFYSFASGFNRTLAFAVNGGRDEAFANDTIEDDLLGGVDDEVWLAGERYFRLMNGFDLVNAVSSNGGLDQDFVGTIRFELNRYGAWS